MTKIKELLHSPRRQLALVTGFCIILMAYVSKRLLSQPIGYVPLAILAFIADAILERGAALHPIRLYAIDFTKLPPGTNRSLGLRREFHARLDQVPITPTSILNGMFTGLLTDHAPFILFKLKRVVYWDDPDLRLDFTTVDDTAQFTAAALDISTPIFL